MQPLSSSRHIATGMKPRRGASTISPPKRRRRSCSMTGFASTARKLCPVSSRASVGRLSICGCNGPGGAGGSRAPMPRLPSNGASRTENRWTSSSGMHCRSWPPEQRDRDAPAPVELPGGKCRKLPGDAGSTLIIRIFAPRDCSASAVWLPALLTASNSCSN